MQRNVSTSLFAQASVLRDMFIVKNNTSRLLVFIPTSPGSDDSVDQSTEGVCSSNFPAPFQASQYPNGGVLKTRAKRVRLSPGHAHFWRRKRNPYRTFLRTEPYRTLQWKRAISLLLLDLLTYPITEVVRKGRLGRIGRNVWDYWIGSLYLRVLTVGMETGVARYLTNRFSVARMGQGKLAQSGNTEQVCMPGPVTNITRHTGSLCPRSDPIAPITPHVILYDGIPVLLCNASDILCLMTCLIPHLANARRPC